MRSTLLLAALTNHRGEINDLSELRLFGPWAISVLSVTSSRSCGQVEQPFGGGLDFRARSAPGRRTARISSPSSSRRHARRLSAWLGRRGGVVPRRGRAGPPARPPVRPQAHASVIVNVHRQTWNAPTFAHTNRTCCWPAPTTSLQSRNVISRRSGRRRAPGCRRRSAAGSVQKNATQPVGSSTSTTRIAPPAGRQVARNVLYRFAVGFPYSVERPGRPAAPLAGPLGQVDPALAVDPGPARAAPAGRGPGTVRRAASFRSRLTTVTPRARRA